jgi:hypothetical protein
MLTRDGMVAGDCDDPWSRYRICCRSGLLLHGQPEGVAVTAYRGFAISSSVPEAPITEAVATAMIENLRRLERWWVRELTDPQDPNARLWGCVANVDIEWGGETPPGPEWVLVQIVAALPIDTPEGDVAFHTVDELGRPLAMILHNADWTVSLSHELLETRCDATCQILMTLLNGKKTPREVCDWIQGTDYCEPFSEVRVANAVGPLFFDEESNTRLLTIASDLTGELRKPLEESPEGYHEIIDPSTGASSLVFGERMGQMTRDRLARTGPRGGKRWRK